MELLQKIQLLLANFCGIITAVFLLLNSMVKGKIFLFTNISDILYKKL